MKASEFVRKIQESGRLSGDLDVFFCDGDGVYHALDEEQTVTVNKDQGYFVIEGDPGILLCSLPRIEKIS